MREQQQQLFAFDASPRFARARTNDPIGSHDAAAAIEAGGSAKADAQRCLNAVRRYPGRTTRELCAVAKLDVHMAGRRLPELAETNLIRKVLFDSTANPTDNTVRCAISRKRAIRWWPI